MTRAYKPSADEVAQVVAVRLQIATGWNANVVGGRIVIRLAPDQAAQLIERLNPTSDGDDAA